MPAYGEGYRFHVTGLVHDETGFPSGKGSDGNTLIRRLLAKVEQRQPKIAEAELFQTEDADIVIVSCRFCRALGPCSRQRSSRPRVKLGLLRPITAWPFPTEAIDAVAKTAKSILEMNMGQMILEVERVVAGRAKVFGLNRIDAELITPKDIVSAPRR